MINALDTLERMLAQAAPYLILAPPRSSSTALARCLLRHSRVGPYIHEPCDVYRHQHAPVASILERLQEGGFTRASLIKAMTFQLGTGDVGRCFLRNARRPLIVLIRDPARAITSRIRMVLRDLARHPDTPPSHRARITQALARKDYSRLDDIVTEAVFPLAHTGWNALASQLETCRREEIDYVILPAYVFRRHPESSLKCLCKRLTLPYEDRMLTWTMQDALRLGGLPDQKAWYRRIVESTGVLPETEAIPVSEQLPQRFRVHLSETQCMYRAMLNDPKLSAVETDP